MPNFGGTPGDDTFTGTGDDESITGLGGNDTLNGGGGSDFVNGGADNDDLSGGAGPDRVIGGDGHDVVDGDGENDYLTGGFGDDDIDGGDGYDRAGYFQLDPAIGGVTVSLLLQGAAQNSGSQGMDILANIEHLSGTPFADTLTGDGGDNWLWGSPATYPDGSAVSAANDDVIDGGGGNDLITVGIGNHNLTGGTGTDTLRFTENGQPASALSLSLLNQGLAQATGNGVWTLGGFENLVGGEEDDTLLGDNNPNLIAGSGGADSLHGNGGDDTLLGDGYVDVDTGGTGYAGPIATFLIGDSSGNDFLNGGNGNDIIHGGGGADRVLGGQTDAGSDTLNGNDGDDYLTGSLGDDVIDGGDGCDRAGYFQGNATAGVTVSLLLQGAPQNTGAWGMDMLTNVENLSGTWFADSLTGDGNANWLWGSTALQPDGVTVSAVNNDTLNGEGGNDLLVVGIGNHVVDGGADTDTLRFTENGQPIENAVTLSLALQGAAQASGNGSWTLGNIENLSGGQQDDQLSGDGNANILAGEGGHDTLAGGGGNDLLLGDGAIDLDTAGTGYSGPIVTYNAGRGSGDDILDGGGGDDMLVGGDGNDALDGGGDDDTALFALAAGTVGTLELVDGTGADAGKLIVRRVDGAVTEELFAIGTAGDVVTVESRNSAAALGTDTVGNVELLRFQVEGSADPAQILEIALQDGVAIDGYIAGGTAFMDLDGDKALDPGEPSTTTGADGSFTLLTGLTGPLVLFGGTNIDTGLPNLLTFSAPTGSTVVNPLTTLVQTLVEQGSTPGDAEDDVKAALGLDSGLDLETYDPFAAPAGDPVALDTQKAAATVVTLIAAGKDVGGGSDAAAAAVIDELASAIGGGGTVDLTDSTTVGNLLAGALPGEDVSAATQDVVDAATDIANATSLDEVSQAQAASLLTGNVDDNILTGGDDHDLIQAQQGGDDSVLGGAGNDTIYFGAEFNEADSVDGGAGTRDRLVLQGDYLAGLTLGAQHLAGIETLLLLPGSVTDYGDPGTGVYPYTIATDDDAVDGGQRLTVDATQLRPTEDLYFDGSAETDGAFTLLGGGCHDFLVGGGGADTINGGALSDVMAGVEGNDRYFVDDADDIVVEFDDQGYDMLFAAVDYALAPGQAIEVLATINNLATTAIDLTGNELDDYIVGNAGANVLNGLGGRDYLDGRGGNDSYLVDSQDIVLESAGRGYDIVYASASHALRGGAEVEVLATVNNLAADAIDLTGNERGDYLIGNAGANLLNGGLGRDYLDGRAGADSYAFTASPIGGNVDTILSFLSGEDRILIDNAVFIGLGLGALDANAFAIGTAAQDADDRIVYDSARGTLLFDADGVGGGAGLAFAIVAPGTIVAASDFTVI